jgi:hypothetical protein
MKKSVFYVSISLLFLIFISSCNKKTKTKGNENKADTTVIDVNKKADTAVIIKQSSVKNSQKKRNKTDENPCDGNKQINPKNLNPLPSWNDTKPKKTIIAFVNSVTNKNSRYYIKPEDRIVTFDNDGTLWAEQPSYFQILFVFDRIKELAKENPKLKRDKLVRAVVNNDLETVRKYGMAGLGNLMSIAQSGMTTDEFTIIMKKWIKTAKHPQTGKLYSQMVYQPMLELINYLTDNGFSVYMVSGSGTDFMRPWSEQVFGIPENHILGSRQKLEYKVVNGKPVLMKLSEVDYNNHNKSKPISIYQIIGKKPVIAFGNADDDIPMLQWTMSGSGKRLAGIIHHTDSVREWAYDKNSRVGELNRGLDEAAKDNWLIIDMKKDWKVIFPYEL